MSENKKIPVYTKVGIRVTIVLMLILASLMLKNCVSSFIYGANTENEAIEYYYNQGFSAGVDQTKRPAAGNELQINNPLLQKAYHKGFREGRDSLRE